MVDSIGKRRYSNELIARKSLKTLNIHCFNFDGGGDYARELVFRIYLCVNRFGLQIGLHAVGRSIGSIQLGFRIEYAL